ncbi:MAG: hypothetical protein HY606_04735 [Planctomycetes bacterium]|nr:hypothetical protein [Planctomycetota bacterium]
MEFKALSKNLDIQNFKQRSLSLKNYERIKNISPQNLLYLLYHLFGSSKLNLKNENGSYIYALETKEQNAYGVFYDYNGKISCGIFYHESLEQDEQSFEKAREASARVLTDFIDKIIVKPIVIGESKYFTTSGRFEYSGKDFFSELGLSDLP